MWRRTEEVNTVDSGQVAMGAGLSAAAGAIRLPLRNPTSGRAKARDICGQPQDLSRIGYGTTFSTFSSLRLHRRMMAGGEAR